MRKFRAMIVSIETRLYCISHGDVAAKNAVRRESLLFFISRRVIKKLVMTTSIPRMTEGNLIAHSVKPNISIKGTSV